MLAIILSIEGSERLSIRIHIMFTHGNSVAGTLTRTILTTPQSCGQSTFQLLIDFALTWYYLLNENKMTQLIFDNRNNCCWTMCKNIQWSLFNTHRHRERESERERKKSLINLQVFVSTNYNFHIASKWKIARNTIFANKNMQIYWQSQFNIILNCDQTMAIKWPHTMKSCKTGPAAVYSPTSDKQFNLFHRLPFFVHSFFKALKKCYAIFYCLLWKKFLHPLKPQFDVLFWVLLELW